MRRERAALEVPTSSAAVRFRELWETRIDVPYSAARRDLLVSLVLNRAVAHAAALGTRYARGALANIARLFARLGAAPPSAVWEMTPAEERWWLNWLCIYTGSDPPPAGIVLDVREPKGMWETVARGCRLLTEPLASRRPLRQFAQEATKPDHEGTPLEFLGRLVCLELARRYVRIHKWHQVAKWAKKAGPDGELLAARADCEIRGPQRELELHSAFRAYQARRLAARCRALSFEAEAERWDKEAAEWDQMAGHNDREDSEGDDRASSEEVTVSV